MTSNPLLATRPELEAAGIRFIEHDGPAELLPGLWFTGPVPRIHPERNYPKNVLVDSPQGPVVDPVAEDSSLVIDTKDGFVVLTGCGHAGVTNTLEAARAVVRDGKVSTYRGGPPAPVAGGARPPHGGGRCRGGLLATRQGDRSGPVGEVVADRSAGRRPTRRRGWPEAAFLDENL